MNQEEQVVQEEGVSTPSPVSQPISYARKNRAERLKQAAIEPDFVKQKVYSTDEILKDYVTNLDQSEIDEIVRSSGIKGSLGEQAAVAVQNALMSYNSMTEYNTLSGGNTINYFTGNNIGDEWRDMGYEAMLNRKELMEINEESVGGVRNWLAKLAGGATSMGQMALEGFATAGVLPMAKMALESYGEGTFNDLKKYADEHEGSLEGYEPKGVDLAINTANGFVQAYIERKLGVASPRFLTGWSRGFWKEGVGGIAQEFLQSEAEELAEVAKGNMEVAELLDNVLDNLIDATVAFPLQGALGAISNGQHRKRADAIMARARAISRGAKEPTKEDYDFAKKINDAKERELASALTTEFKSAFDETTGEGKLQKKIAGEIKHAVEAKKLDLDTANETELAQRIEQIATQETLTAIEDALEKGKSVSELALNNIVYEDGAIWLEGLTPELGDKAVGYARVLAERQSGLAKARNQLDAINAEIKQTKADLVQAQQEKQESRVKVLQARIAKQNALAEKNRIHAEKLEAQTAKLEKQIAKQTEQVKVAEPVKTEKVSAEEVKPVEVPKREELARIEPKPVVRTSLKKERAIKTTQTGITRKLDADSKFVKVIDKPSNVDFSDGKEYEDSSKRYLLNKVVIKEQDGNLYFKLSGGRYTPTSYVVIENYVNTDPYEIFSAQVEEGKEIGDHFDRAVQDFYKEKGLWSLAEPVKLRSWEEYMKDSGQVTAQPSVQVSEQIDESSLEQYDPRKQYNKYDMVRVRTQSGEHIGVWDGSRMTLHETIEEAQDFIKNDTEREEANRQADERRATAQKEESEKQEKAFREGQGFVEMPYIIQLLKDNDMWEDLSLREKGNFNAIGSVMFSNGRIVNAFGNENSKKGTKVTQNTLDTIQKLRDKLNQSKPTGDMESWAGKTREEVGKNMTNGSDRFLKIVIPTKGNSFIAANKETLDKIDMFAQATFLQHALVNDKITPDMISEIFDFVENMPQGNYLSNVYYDIMVKPTTPTDVALKAKDKYNRAMVDSTTQEDWSGKTSSEIATEKIKTVFGVFQSEIKKYEKKGVITDTDAEEKDADFAQIGSELLDKELLEYIFMKYNFDPRVIEWIRDNPNLLQNNEEQEDSWEIGSGSNLVDILGEPLDYAPDGLKQIDIYDEKEPEFDYDTTVYKMPQTQEEFENKVVSAMYKQTAKGLDLQETELQDATPNDDRTPYLFQGSIGGKGDTARGGYDDALKRIILGEKSDLSTIQHEFAHYWMQNNFKWARSGLASQDWLRRWRDVEEWLGIEPQDRLLSKSASEKFAKAYERYILEGKVAPELQWAFEGFQKAYQDIYSELENEYFDLSEELAPEVVDWFNRNKEQSPKRLLEADTKKIEKQIALSAGASVIEDVDGNVVMTEQNKEGDPVVYMGVKESEIPAGDNLLVQADKTTASKLQQSAKRWLSDKVEVQQLTTLDTQATLENFKNWIARDRAGAWDAMMNPDTRPIYRTYLYKAFAQEAMNDADLAVELANIDMGQAVREMGQAIQALDIRNESGFDTLEIMRNIEKSKGEISTEELNKEVESIGLDMIELSQADIDEIEFDTECKL